MMKKSLLASLFLGMASASLPSFAGDPVHSCVINVAMGNKNNI